MFSKITLALLAASLISSASYARELSFKEGYIQAQTSILGDSNIDPKSTFAKTKLSMDTSPESLKGEISLDLATLKSENSQRDEHMYDTLHVKENKSTVFTLKEVKKETDGYHLLGTLLLNKQSKEIDSKAKITEQNDLVTLKGGFEIKMTDFGIEQPTLLFLSVRDEVAITYDLTLTSPAQ